LEQWWQHRSSSRDGRQRLNLDGGGGVRAAAAAATRREPGGTVWGNRATLWGDTT
jgi:hypothetical protein